MHPVIWMSGIGKQYRLGRPEPYRTLRESLMRALLAPFQRPSSSALASPADGQTIWALKNVSLEILPGQVVGIIGPNGAGKSTLLKILSRITEPSTGEAALYGRVGSLLEVGTGFHPELTGRENIHLNGAILGMKKAEIERRFDEIVAFAEIEPFIDTPVKRYSSGMYMRLAFAVAAHLDPEILIIDEVLAVGDAAFQKKCLGQMSKVAGSGRTVLFVSHNMGAIREICTRAVWLQGGQVRFDGEPAEAVRLYLHESSEGEGERLWRPEAAPGDDKVRLESLRMLDDRGSVGSTFGNSRQFHLEIAYRVLQPVRGFLVGVIVSTDLGVNVLTTTDAGGAALAGLLETRSPGAFVSRCTFPADLLAPGQYLLYVAGSSPTEWPPHFECHNALSFTVEDTGGGGPGRTPGQRWPGVIWPVLEWKAAVAEVACRQ